MLNNLSVKLNRINIRKVFSLLEFNTALNFDDNAFLLKILFVVQ